MDDATSESPNSDEDEFGIIRPSLIKQLRSILDQYPDDGQILKELIQNAEDAKATKVCFLYDETQYGTDPEKLAHPELGLHQGPALYAFNDAVFAANDWKGIRMLQDSVKTKDPMKVGRFGLGFKSVFHLTDMPSVLSDKWLGFIDPHEKYFKFEGDRTTGTRYKLSDDHSNFPHQFEPFQNVFDCDQEIFREGRYKGTIFRFPLRQQESALSDTLYTPQKMSDLLSSFQRDAHLILLFLKHVESVELCVRRKGSPIQTVFKVQIQDSCKLDVRAARQAFLAKLSATSWLEEPAQLIFPIHLETIKYEHGKMALKEDCTLLISEYFAGGDAITETLKGLCCDQKRRNIPLVGVAYLLKVMKSTSSKRKSSVDADHCGPAGPLHKMVKIYKTDKGAKGTEVAQFEPDGHVFCSLPLPVEQRSCTGLPVHVNGYFSISQDRRHLKWPSQGQDIHSDKEILWNQCLLQELIPKAYLNLILQTVQLCKEDRLGITPQHVLQALPDKNEVEARERWLAILEPFYTQLLKHNVLYSPVDGGQWTQISECVIDRLEEPPEICSAARKILLSIAVKVVRLPRHVIQALDTYSTQQLKTITPQSTRNYVIAFISAHGKKLSDEMKTCLTAEEKRALCEFLGKADDCLLPAQIKLLSSLPLFETIPYGKNRITDFTAVNDISNAAPLSLPIENVETPLLDLRRVCFKNLAKTLGVKVLSHADFITDVVFLELKNNQEVEKLEQTMDYVMNNFKQLKQEKADFIGHVQGFPFLLNENGEHVSVLELFDPEDAFLKSFFYAEDKFPKGNFADGQHLSFLRQIGLKPRSGIQPRDVVSSALKVHNLRDSNTFNLRGKSSALIEHVHENGNVLLASVQGKQVKDWLTDICWMHCLKNKPDIFPAGLDFYGGQLFLDPRSLLPQEAVPLAGLVTPICESPYGGPVLKALGFSVIPSVTQVLLQMKMITEAYHPSEKARFLHLVKSIYKHLENVGVSDVQKALSDLKVSKWVWNGDGFDAIDKVISCQTPMDFRPYLFPLPEELKMFETMFCKLGMHENCCEKTLVAVLQHIKDAHSSENAAVPALRVRDLQMSVNILNLLKDQLDPEDEIVRDQIVIPVRKNDETALCLMPIEECTYCDLEWLQHGNQSIACDETEDVALIHPSVPLSTAEALNVPTLMNRMLQADELPVTGFGQGETLTNRIRSLLEDYTDGYSIVKELVQNADDAGATVVKFMYDERSNIDCEILLLNEGMKECQGPAFWAYNNALFSEKDFENITKLGGATKEKETDKIGKFGLGFNAVYNVTDVPSFISGRYLVIFDPQTKHLGRAIRDRSKPGIRIDLKKNRTLVRKLPHQFHPYRNVFDCSIDADVPKEYAGTLFRLPLRTARQASCSEISNQSYDKHEMMKLLSLFLKESDSLLLFTQHVNRIELHHMPSTDCEPVMLFTVEKEKKNTITPLVINPCVEFDVLTKCNKHFRDVGHHCEPKVNDVMETSMVVQMKTTVTKNGCLYFSDSTESSIKTWMISFIFNMTCNSEAPERVFNSGFCPYGAAAIPLKSCGDDFIPDPLSMQSNEGSLYCHLPLPITTNLPVHINGSFAVRSNRRQLHELTADDKNSWKADWNNFLLKNAICPAYTLLLQDLLRVNKATRVEYVHLWPALHSAHTKLDPLVEAFYVDKFRMLVMVRDGQKHVTLSEAAIFKKSLSSNLKHKALAVQVFEQSSKLSVINIAEEILETMCRVNHIAVEPQMFDDARFLLEIFFPHVSQIDHALRDEVLVWALKLENEEIKATVRKTACIPASPKGNILKKPSELIYPDSKAVKLYNSSEGKFVHLTGCKNITRLVEQLGMKSDFLAWEDLIERGHSIEKLFMENPDAAHDRAKIFLRYMDSKLQKESYGERNEIDSDLKQASKSLCQSKILPLAVPPGDNLLKWANEDLPGNPLVSAVEAYLSSEASLLSSCCPLVNETLIPNNVQEFLELHGKPVTIDQVLRQLESVLGLDLRKTSSGCYRNLQTHIEKIYSFLNDECGRDKASKECRMIYGAFGQRACILIDRRFMRPCDLAFDDKVGAVSSFLYSLPDDYHQWKTMLEVLGVKEKFEPADYVVQLEQLQARKAGHPVGGMEHLSCMGLLTGLWRCMERTEQSTQEVVENCGEIYAPDAAGILMPSSKLFYNDCPWRNAQQDTHLTHSDISYSMAKILGLKTLRWEMMKDHVTGIPFGQTAKITTTLRRIVDYYPLDHEILKELIQNADDATATKIHFVLDHRTHGTEQLFDESWKPLQGPALCVYNNRPFTSRDLEGIQDLGEGSKRKDPCKTGKYGIGFSSVYHLTDVPSIMTNNADTGHVLCVFDPHCCYVPGASIMAPGQMYRDLESLRSKFPDVFTGYLENDFNLHNSTMFRFPLRTSEMAKKSEISTRHISATQVKEMMDKLRGEALPMMLFLNYLENLEFSVVNKGTKKLSLQYAVQAHLSEDDKLKRQAFHQKCLEIGKQLKSREIAIEDVKQEKVEYTVLLDDNKGRKEKWRVTQVIGFSNPNCVPNEIREAYKEGKLVLLPKGGVASLLDTSQMTHRPYVASDQTPHRPSGYILGKAYCSLPTSSLLDTNQKTHHPYVTSDQTPHRPIGYILGKAYCSLPTPIETQLPVHINGQFAMSFENRRHIWLTSGADTPIKLDWNHMLCKEVISTAYVEMLKSIREDVLGLSRLRDSLLSRKTIEQALIFYEHFFPEYEEKSEDWSSLVTAVYSLIASTKAQLFPCIRECNSFDHIAETTRSIQWVSLVNDGSCKALFCLRGVPLKSDKEIGFNFGAPFMQTVESEKICLKEILRKCHFIIIEINKGLMDTIKKGGFDIDLASPEKVMAIFKSYNKEEALCDIGATLPIPIGQTNIRDLESLIEILKYCKTSASSIGIFEGTPLFLTNDCNLHVFDSKTPAYKKGCCRLIAQSCGDVFVHENIEIVLNNLDRNEQILKTFTIEALLNVMPRLFATEYQVSESLPLKPKDSQYVMEVWDFVSHQASGKCQRRCYQKKRHRKYESIEDYEQRLACVAKSLTESLKSWCILPVTTKAGEVSLYKVSRAGEAVDRMGKDSWSSKLMNALDKLDIPKLANDVFSSTYVIRKLLAGFDQPVQILSAVFKVYDECKTAPDLSKTEMRMFLEYFGEKVSTLQYYGHADVVRQLRTIPFYETICGDFIPLTNCAVYVLPADVLIHEMDVWQNKSGNVFLGNQEKLISLFIFIDCASLGVIKLYSEFILQHFDYLTRDAQVAHLKHLFDTYLNDDAYKKDVLSEREKNELLLCMKNLSVIADEKGELHPASYFYDPDITLFTIMIEKDKLAPLDVHLSRQIWLSMLRRIGLIQQVTPEMCFEFARQIAFESQSIRKTLASQRSKVLVRHLLSLESDNKNEILQRVCTIPFIATERIPQELAELYFQYGDIGENSYELPYISFKGSYSQVHVDIIWTCASVLPQWADPFAKPDGEELAQMLGVDITPSIELVAHNFNTICTSCREGQDLNSAVLKRVCKKSYEFMQQYGLDDEQPKSALQDLRDAPCIAVGGSENFAKPCQTTIDMLDTDEIRPYFFKIPYDYGDYKPLFVALGASESPRFGQYAKVLDALHIETAEEQLIPSEMQLVCKALKGLFTSLEKESGNPIGPTVESLSLLGEKSCLYESKRLIFNDAPWLYDRVKSNKIQFLVNLKECGLKEDPKELLSRLPSQYKPRMLSTCVKEVLVDDSKKCLVPTELTQKLQKQLHGDVFRSAIVRLAHHQAHKTGQKLNEQTLSGALDNLSTMKILGVEDIHTHLLHRNHIVKGSRMQKKCCVEKIVDPLGTEVHYVYLKNNTAFGNDILIPFVEALNSVLNGILKDSAMFLLPILSSNVDVDVKACLDEHDVFPFSSVTRDPILPSAGTIVPDKFHHHLVDAGTSSLQIGNYVAVKAEGDQYIYGKVREVHENGMCRLNTGKDGDEEIMIQSLKTLARSRKC